MSSIKRGVKKVFRGAKRVVKKIAKPALIAGAIYLTAGLATGGFAAAPAGSGLPGFFKSVGTTFSNGVSAVHGALGIGQATTTAPVAGSPVAGGADLFSTQAVGLAKRPLTQRAVEEATKKSGIFSAVGGLLGKASNVFQGLSDPVQTAIIGGFSGALSNAAERKEVRRLERREDELGFMGVQRRGSGGVITGDFGAAVREGFGLDTPATAQAAQPPRQSLLDPLRAQEEDEDESVMASGFGLERGLLAQSQLNMPNFI